MFRDLIFALAKHYRVVAPHLPGFGMTRTDPAFEFTFAHLADVIDAFTDAMGLDTYPMYVFDDGAPVGWRLAVRHPERITAIVRQNGNGYQYGLSPGWAPMRAAWVDPSIANREGLRTFNSFEITKWQYTEGVRDVSRVAPDGYALAFAAIERIGVDAQLDLLVDYERMVKIRPRAPRTWPSPPAAARASAGTTSIPRASGR